MFFLSIQEKGMQPYAEISFEISGKKKTMLKDYTTIVAPIQVQSDKPNILLL